MNFIITKEGEKFCTGCGRIKLEEFGRDQGWCRECKYAAHKEYYRKNKAKFQQKLKENYEKRRKEIMCECGRLIYNVSLKTHLKTLVHFENLLKKEAV